MNQPQHQTRLMQNKKRGEKVFLNITSSLKDFQVQYAKELEQRIEHSLSGL
jgi:hypothetical protein